MIETPELIYDVCLSFAGEIRPYVEKVAEYLRHSTVDVFYDNDDEQKIRLWGKDLAEEFTRIYGRESRYCVIFVNSDYLKKEWTNWERRNAISKAVKESTEYILPVRMEPNVELKGIPKSTKYIDASNLQAEELARMILQKVHDTSDFNEPMDRIRIPLNEKINVTVVKNSRILEVLRCIRLSHEEYLQCEIIYGDIEDVDCADVAELQIRGPKHLVEIGKRIAKILLHLRWL